MIHEKLIHPKSIVVIGGSDDKTKPGGKILKNLKDSHFRGSLYVVNPKSEEIQGIRSYHSPKELPEVDMAILAIPANYCLQTIEVLAKEKNTRGFIIISAGFSEENEEGAFLEKSIVEVIESVGGSLIGPNCIGVINQSYSGVFTTPTPKLDPLGVDFISGSGATALFIMESGITKGLTFSSLYSVGNSAQIGVEEVVKHLDETFHPETSSKIKLLYLESIHQPEMLLKHTASLIKKGCKIAAIKAGSSEAGSRAASSHTGALASSDVAVDALFRKAGIVRCYGREELVTVASVFMHPVLKDKNMAIITHAGGPAVMLTDVLSNGGITVPRLKGDKANALREKLFPGSSVTNPIDFLATGNAKQLGHIIDACENDFEEIDAMTVIFGSPGLCPVYDVYEVLHKKMHACKKPIYPVMPSLINAHDEIEAFLKKGRVYFPDEVLFGEALCKVYNTPLPSLGDAVLPKIDKEAVREVMDHASNGYLSPEQVQKLLDAAGISRVHEAVVKNSGDAIHEARKLGYPVVMKVIGPVHKSDVGGVVLSVSTDEEVKKEFDRMMKIKDTTAILIQPMLNGLELFAGVKYEPVFGHLVLCGLGGIFVEVLKDVKAGLAPLYTDEAEAMMKGLKGYGMLKGVRGQKGVNEEKFMDTIIRLSALAMVAPEIYEMDLNPLLGTESSVTAVDARIRVEK